MGGREVGGLANQLAAHMNFTPPDIDRVRRFWKAPRIATHEGLKAVQLFEAINRGEVKALWVMGTNPAVSLPDADVVREALKKLELFVVSENVLSNDTVEAGPHVLLPALAWGEKSGTVTNSERRISRQRSFLPAPGEARPDWWILERDRKAPRLRRQLQLQIRRRYFPRARRALGVRERWQPRFRHRRADLAVGRGLRRLEAGAMAGARRRGAGERFFANGGFFTNDGKGRFVAPEVPALRGETGPSRPLRLNTGRIRDQWHTMTRTGLSQRLGAHLPEPFVEIHPDDASKYGIAHDGYRPHHHRLRPVHPEGRRQRPPAARHAVRADPLERDERLARPRRGAGRSPSPIRSRASRSPRRRRRRSRLMNTSSAALRCRASSSICRRT